MVVENDDGTMAMCFILIYNFRTSKNSPASTHRNIRGNLTPNRRVNKEMLN